MKTLPFLLLMASASMASAQDTMKGGYVACASDDLIHEYISSVNDGDKMATMYLLENGCIVTRRGTKITVLDQNWRGISKVRAYSSNGAIMLWTFSENVKRVN